KHGEAHAGNRDTTPPSHASPRPPRPGIQIRRRLRESSQAAEAMMPHLAIAAFLALAQAGLASQPISGVVTSSKGPEPGVWVIAETADLPTKFVRIVVTDDHGRYLLPDLPTANYQVFVRGYGLLDSRRQPAKPGQQLNIKVQVAPDARSAAQVYPAAWWLSMLPLPNDREFQRKFPMDMKECYGCHQVGPKTTREIGPNSAPGASSTVEAWYRRTRDGPSGPSMGTFFQAIGEQRKIFADWVDRIV